MDLMIWLCQQRLPAAAEAAARKTWPSIHGISCLCITDPAGHLSGRK